MGETYQDRDRIKSEYSELKKKYAELSRKYESEENSNKHKWSSFEKKEKNYKDRI